MIKIGYILLLLVLLSACNNPTGNNSKTEEIKDTHNTSEYPLIVTYGDNMCRYECD